MKTFALKSILLSFIVTAMVTSASYSQQKQTIDGGNGVSFISIGESIPSMEHKYREVDASGRVAVSEGIRFVPTKAKTAERFQQGTDPILFSRYRIALNGGWSYRIAKLADNIPADMKQYMKELNSGYQFGLDASYYFTQELGAGLKYSSHLSNNSIDNALFELSDGSTVEGRIANDIRIDFVGPFFSARRSLPNNRHSLLVNFGLGYMSYRDDGTLLTNFTAQGNTLGLCGDISYDISLTNNFAIGLQLSYLAGSLQEYELTHGGHTQTIKLENDKKESLSRIDFSLGLRFTR
jgi:hypothetical protein